MTAWPVRDPQLVVRDRMLLKFSRDLRLGYRVPQVAEPTCAESPPKLDNNVMQRQHKYTWDNVFIRIRVHRWAMYIGGPCVAVELDSIFTCSGGQCMSVGIVDR